MKKTTFVFPGQASQYVGMARDLFEEFDSAKEMFELASEKLRYDLADVCFNGPEEKLRQTAFTQPAVFVHSCALDMVLRENGVIPETAAGHSLGEYSALVSAGAVSFEDGIQAIAIRSRSMQNDCDQNPGTMAAVIGLEFDDVVAALKDLSGIVVPANYNSPGQVVIAGESAAVLLACDKLKEAGAKRALPIPVGGAYHSPLMEKSSDLMKEFILNQMNFTKFNFPVYSNVEAEPLSDEDRFKSALAKQISSPVLWYPTIRNMYRDGVRKFVEVGPGKVLQGLVKRSLDDPDIEIIGIDNLESLDQFLNNNAKVGSV